MKAIPKTIHFCWFGGGELPPLAIKCINSWKNYLPDYEIKRWDESNFDVNIIPYVSQAYKAKKYAFVSDFARFWILYQYGGLYFDTDVEVIRPMDNIVASGPFMGCENSYDQKRTTQSLGVAPGLGIGVYHRHPFYKEVIDLYSTLNFVTAQGSFNQKTVVDYITELLYSKGLTNTAEIQEVSGIKIYPKDYFCPVDYITNKTIITNNTVSIHHYSGSWLGRREKINLFFRRYFGSAFTKKCGNLLRIFGYKRQI